MSHFWLNSISISMINENTKQAVWPHSAFHRLNCPVMCVVQFFSEAGCKDLGPGLSLLITAFHLTRQWAEPMSAVYFCQIFLWGRHLTLGRAFATPLSPEAILCHTQTFCFLFQQHAYCLLAIAKRNVLNLSLAVNPFLAIKATFMVFAMAV